MAQNANGIATNNTIIFHPIIITHFLRSLLLNVGKIGIELFLFVLLFTTLPSLLPVKRGTGEKRHFSRKQICEPALFPAFKQAVTLSATR
jgi:hypothetical protein